MTSNRLIIRFQNANEIIWLDKWWNLMFGPDKTFKEEKQPDIRGMEDEA